MSKLRAGQRVYIDRSHAAGARTFQYAVKHVAAGLFQIYEAYRDFQVGARWTLPEIIKLVLDHFAESMIFTYVVRSATFTAPPDRIPTYRTNMHGLFVTCRVKNSVKLEEELGDRGKALFDALDLWSHAATPIWTPTASLLLGYEPPTAVTGMEERRADYLFRSKWELTMANKRAYPAALTHGLGPLVRCGTDFFHKWLWADYSCQLPYAKTTKMERSTNGARVTYHSSILLPPAKPRKKLGRYVRD